MRMALFISICLALIFGEFKGQQDWNIRQVQGVNTFGTEIGCCLMGKDLIVCRGLKGGSYDDRGRKDRNTYELLVAGMTTNYSNMEVTGAVNIPSWAGDIGTACYSESDSTLWFSGVKGMRMFRESTIKIYSSKWNGRSWSEPMPFAHNNDHYSYAHPWYDHARDRLIFSSNRPGGSGKMDLWYCNRNRAGWGDPIWFAGNINSMDNEVFPSMHENKLYFSSDREFGLDLYESSWKSQFKECEKLPEPFNSRQDDLQLIFLDSDKAFVSSNRESFTGSDNIFLLSRNVDGQPRYTGLLECKGTAMQGVVMTFENILGEVALQETTSSDGSVDLGSLEFERQYSVSTEGIPSDLLAHAYFYVLDEDGNRIKVFKLGEDGTFIYELLQGDELSGIEGMNTDDESVLVLEMEGVLYKQEPGDIAGGEAVYITSTDGELLALAYTSSRGNFSFDDLRPLSNYLFKVDQNLGQVRMTLSDGDETVDLEVIEGIAQYDRLRDDEAIKLLDEFNRPIEIGEDEVFIIKNIYYQFDSTSLNTIAEGQLMNLSNILKKNVNIGIELTSHTDSRGTNEYNLELSQSRATKAAQFIVARGISSSRISHEGRGETELLNECDDESECPETLHALNRRTEIRIISKPLN